MEKKRLVVLLPWLGAKPSAVTNYEKLYATDSFDVYIRYTVLKDFLWPKSGLQSCSHTLDEIKEIVDNNTYSGIVIHAFSIGCYYYSLMVYQMRRAQGKYNKVWNLISAHVMDSPVLGTIREMATGVSRMVTQRPAVSSLIKYVCLFYFAITNSQTVSYYDMAIDEVKYHAPLVPSLLVTSTGDPVLVIKAFNEFCDEWAKFRPTARQIWQDSSHVEHLRYHRDEYKTLLRQVLEASSKFSSSLPAIQSKL